MPLFNDLTIGKHLYNKDSKLFAFYMLKGLKLIMKVKFKENERKDKGTLCFESDV